MAVAVDMASRLALSGDSLSAGTIQWGQRKEPLAAIGLTRRDLSLMALLHDVNCLSSSQLTILGWGASRERAGQKLLKRLHDAGYLDRFRPTPTVGSAEWNYRLSTPGWTALAAQGIVSSDCPYTPTNSPVSAIPNTIYSSQHS